LPGRNFVQVGLRGYYPDNELIDWMREQGMRSHFMAEVERHGLDAVVDLAISEALDGPEHLYISFDIDVLDPAYAPGTGTPEPGGFTTREMFPVVRRLCAEAHVVGMEVVEVAPGIDPSYTTALNANRVVVEALTGLAMRKLGLTDPRHLNAATSGAEPFATGLQVSCQPGLAVARRSCLTSLMGLSKIPPRRAGMRTTRP